MIYCQTVTGIVTDSTKTPIENVTVAVKGTKQKTLTNAAGRFSIKITPSNKVLQFFATGYYTLEMTPNLQKTIHAVLRQSVSSLDEVQVIAYGTTTQRYNVGSVSKITAKEIERQPISNPLAALQGRVPGLVVTASSGLPGSSFTAQIRGQNTLASKINGLPLPIDNPLFVIDGVPYAPQNVNINQMHSVGSPGAGMQLNNNYGGSSPFNSINPSDIESIEVLRDADATAIYGSRGGNGVILITTKRGQAGKTDFSLNVSNGASLIGKTMPMMNTREYLTMRREAMQNDGITPNLTTFWDPSYAPDLLAFDTTKYTDWKDYFLGNTAHNTMINSALSGGNANTTFRIAAGYNRNTYIYPGDFAENRASFAINLHHNSTNKKFNIDFSSSFAYDKNNSPGSPNLLKAYQLEPNFPDLVDKNNNLIWSYKGLSFNLGMGDNPIAYLRKNYYLQSNMLNSNLQVSYKIKNDLSFRTSLGYNTLLSKEYSGSPSAALNPFQGLTPSADFGTNNFMTWIIEPQAEYKKKIAAGVLNILAGSSIQYNTNATTRMIGTGYTNDDLIESINAAPYVSAGDKYSEYRYAAIFGRINYIYQNKYIINLNGRRDGSSRFGPGKQFGNFGSIGAGWLFAEERYIKENLSWLSYGKLRASYGLTGGDGIGDYQYISRWATTPYPYGNKIGYLPQNLYNPLLVWASTKKTELGLELGFLQDKILLSTSFFRDISGNQLISYYLPSQTGFGSVTENWDADVQNTGLEFTVQSQNIRKKDFRWSTSFNLSIPKNKLRSFPGLETSSYALTYKVGLPLNTIFGFDYAGVNPQTGLFQFRTKDGELTSTPTHPSGTDFGDYIKIGSTSPKFYGGLQNSFTYKGIQLDIFLEFKKQMGINYLQQAYSGIPGQEFNVPKALLGRWQKPGDISDFQKFTASYGDAGRTILEYYIVSSAGYSDASYIRFKTINLSYDLNKLIRHTALKSLRIYGAAQNLFTITNYLGNDPETQSLYGVPVLKTFVLGLQLTL